MEVKKFNDIDIYQTSLILRRIGNVAVNLTLIENRKLNIPNVFSNDNIIYYETADGCISRISPFLKMKARLEKAIKDSQSYSNINDTIFI